jgi:hypothetical protein
MMLNAVTKLIYVCVSAKYKLRKLISSKTNHVKGSNKKEAPNKRRKSQKYKVDSSSESEESVSDY